MDECYPHLLACQSVQEPASCPLSVSNSDAGEAHAERRVRAGDGLAISPTPTISTERREFAHPNRGRAPRLQRVGSLEHL